MSYKPRVNNPYSHLAEQSVRSQLQLDPNGSSTGQQSFGQNGQQTSMLQEFTKNSHLAVDQKELDREYERQLISMNQAQNAGGLLTREEAAGKKQRNMDPISTFWSPPRAILALPDSQIQALRDKYRIAVYSPIEERIPPPIETFQQMRLPPQLITALAAKGIMSPKPIQMQGLSVALSGRDMIGIAQTGGGKTVVFAVPLVALAFRDELRCPMRKSEGPFALVLAPQRELAVQIHQFIEHLCYYISQPATSASPTSSSLTATTTTQPDPQTPSKPVSATITSFVAIGGLHFGEQWGKVEQGRGFHCLVGTPGKVCELITKKTINLARCKFFCLDEADRLVNDSFRTELQSVLGAFEGPKQTILFSATMPPRVKELATHALKHPITVNVGQAGTANKDITQTAICVQEEEKFEALLKVLQRTPPPVLVFANSHSTVDLVYEFLCIKGVEAGCIHSQIDQVNRSKAVEDLKEGHTEVLVATDLLAKGIDFEHKHIEHVINFDLPEEIEQYVHRIGRTGRAGRKGIATTFFNDKTSKHQLLLDLKQLLVQAEQVVPLELAELKSDLDFIFQSSEENIVCTQCGGHGHTIMYCPQLLKKQPKHRRGGMDTVQTRD